MEEQDLENNFEKLLREKADGFQLKPTAGVWTAVSNSLQSNKHKRRYLWLWAAAVGLLIGAGSATLYFLSDTDVKKTATITEITDHETTSKEIPLPDKQSIITEKEPSHNPETALQVNETKPLLPAAEKEAAPIHKKVTTTTGLKGASAILKSVTSKNAAVPDKAVTENGSLTFEYIQTADPSPASPQQQDNNNLSIMAIEPLPPSESKLAYENPVAVLQPSANQIPIPSFKPSRFSISGEITPLISWINYGNQSGLGLTSSDQLMADSVSSLNQSNSKPLIGFSTSISGSYRISERFALSTGLHFSKTGEKNQVLQSGLQDFYATEFGSVNNSGGGPTTAANSSETLASARYSWLDWSLKGEWFFYNHPLSRFSLSTGAGVSHFMKYTLSVPGNGEASIVNTSFFKNEQQPPVFHNYQLTGLAGLNYYHTISNHFKITTGLQFKYYLTSVTLSEIPVSAHPYWLGWNIGVVYGF